MSSNHSQAPSFGGHQSDGQVAVPRSQPIPLQGARRFHSHQHGQSSPYHQDFNDDYVLVDPSLPVHSPHYVPFSPSSKSFSSASSSVPPSSSSSLSNYTSSYESDTPNRGIEDSISTVRAASSSSYQTGSLLISRPTMQPPEPDLPYEVSLSGLPREWRVDINIKPIIELSKNKYSINDTTSEYTALRLPLGVRARASNDFDVSNAQILDVSAEAYCTKNLKTPALPCASCCGRVRKARAQGASNSAVSMIEFSGAPLVSIANGRAKLRFKVNCYCSHHSESEGFRIRFTLHRHDGTLVGQVLTDPIRIIDKRNPKFKLPSDDNHSVESATPSTTTDFDTSMESVEEVDPFTLVDLQSEAPLLMNSFNPPSMDSISQSIEYKPRPIPQQHGKSWNNDWQSPPPAAHHHVPRLPMRINNVTLHAFHEQVEIPQRPGAGPPNVTPQIIGMNPSEGPCHGGHVEIYGVNFNQLFQGCFWIAFGNVHCRIDRSSTSSNGVLQIVDDNRMRYVVPRGTPFTRVAVRLLAGETLNAALQTPELPARTPTFYTYTYNAIANDPQIMTSPVNAQFVSNIHMSQFPPPFQ